MAQHEVCALVDTKVIGRKDLRITVKRNGAKLRTLLISKGNIEWLSAKNSTNKRRVSWQQFADLMEVGGKPAKARK